MQTSVCLGIWLGRSLRKQYWRAGESRKAWHSSRSKSCGHRSRLIPCAKMWDTGKDQPGWTESFGWNSREKLSLLSLEEGAATQEDYKDIMKLHRERIRRAEVQLELNLATAVNDNKNVFINRQVTKGRSRRISILYWIQEKQHQRTRKRLKYLMPSFPQSW